MNYDTPEKMERRASQLAQEIIDSGKVRYGSRKWQRLVALIGLSPSDMDYDAADEGMWRD